MELKWLQPYLTDEKDWGSNPTFMELKLFICGNCGKNDKWF